VFSTIIMAVFNGVLPWCKWFPLMIAVRFIAGLGAGGFNTGINLIKLELGLGAGGVLTC
jgi:hypothetical protein